jgi:hypothetical protein
MASTAVDVADRSDRSGGKIECVYDLDRLYATLLQGREVAPNCPREWDVGPAFDRKLTTAEFAPITERLAAMRATGGPANDYRARQAYLSASLLAQPIWPVTCRYGVAFLTIRMGMADHGYVLRPHSLAAALLCDPEHLFDKAPEHVFLMYRTAEELEDLLREAYVPQTPLAATNSVNVRGRRVRRHHTSNLAMLLFEEGDITKLRQRAHTGDWAAAYWLFELWASRGDISELRKWADAGHTYASEKLSEVLSTRGHVEELR